MSPRSRAGGPERVSPKRSHKAKREPLTGAEVAELLAWLLARRAELCERVASGSIDAPPLLAELDALLAGAAGPLQVAREGWSAHGLPAREYRDAGIRVAWPLVRQARRGRGWERIGAIMALESLLVWEFRESRPAARARIQRSLESPEVCGAQREGKVAADEATGILFGVSASLVRDVRNAR